MERLTAVVTGANGFLGRHMARLLAQKGFSVLGVGHGEWSESEQEMWGLSEWHCCEVTLQTLRLYAGSPQIIVHCAGSGSVAFSTQNPLEDFRRTVVTTANVLEYVRLHAPACRIVYPSSASIYGTAEILPIREDLRAAPVSPYGTHKLMAEQMIASHARQFGTSASIVRLFSVYGCGLRKQLLWDACCKFSEGDKVFMGTGNELRDWLHVEDAAELMLAAANHASAECPVVNGGSGEGVTVREVLTHLGGNLFAREVSPIFSGRQRTGDPSRYVASIEAAAAWGWRPRRNWRKGLEEYANWWKTGAL